MAGVMLVLDIATKALVMEGKSLGEAACLAGYYDPPNLILAIKKRVELTLSELVSLSKC